MPGRQDVAELRARLAQEREEGEKEMAAAYRAGRAMPFGAVASLALRLLEEGIQSLASSEGASQTAQQAWEPAAGQPRQSPLSAREQEVLRLVAQGLSSKKVGRQLSLSASTVNQHVKAIFNKLGVDTRAQAVAVAAQRRLL
jgi:DNA-binding NarL/FixJ family response regulator